jgi:hypothetical protein
MDFERKINQIKKKTKDKRQKTKVAAKRGGVEIH